MAQLARSLPVRASARRYIDRRKIVRKHGCLRRPIVRGGELVHAPAHATGLGELFGFIERGLRAFKQMKGATAFLNTIHDREFLILEQIFSGGPLGDWSARSFVEGNVS